MNNQARTLFYGIIGAYLVYLAYDLWPVREGMEGAGATGMLVCCILFVVAGVVFLALAVRLFKKVFIDKDENYLEGEPEEIVDAETVEDVNDEAVAESAEEAMDEVVEEVHEISAESEEITEE